MAITKILNIMESEGRNPASHLKNALEYIQNPDKTEECVLVGGINCLPDTAFEQMEETKNIFHKTGKRLTLQNSHQKLCMSLSTKLLSMRLIRAAVNVYRKLKLSITISEYSTIQRSFCGKEKRYST